MEIIVYFNLLMLYINSLSAKNTSVNISWIIDKARELQKNICFLDYNKGFVCVDHNKLWNILKETRILDHLTCLLRKLYAGQEATFRIGRGTMDWLQIGKGLHMSRLSPCLFNLYVEYIMWNARLDESQAGIKIARRNTNNLRCTDWYHSWQKVKRN